MILNDESEVGYSKEVGAFERYDCPIQTRIQEYYCRSLAREVDMKFYAEVEFFSQENESKNINEYNFCEALRIETIPNMIKYWSGISAY